MFFFKFKSKSDYSEYEKIIFSLFYFLEQYRSIIRWGPIIYLSSRSNHSLVVVFTRMLMSLGHRSRTSLNDAAPPMTRAF